MTWDEMWTWLDSLSVDDPDKYEMWAFIYMTLARASWRRVDQLKVQERRTRVREARGH